MGGPGRRGTVGVAAAPGDTVVQQGQPVPNAGSRL